ncbi:uncharacterized protein RHOBADRAFT_46321 [Rhodotorula graminis WP1]|uniref:Uncharacterized protein n=1 Tax=Rhodotorula graminis (strain WP1) TaxID=578459 RepID=A0A0P9ITJ4_RHOGW|nr:uncharacterized protein RHOBADRAFT_46321 [Rhodotorula graminis WP1]KPV72726.1 hypothetical protein RHOBADRAFT_46321 [Rhodotorula graminis WP1]
MPSPRQPRVSVLWTWIDGKPVKVTSGVAVSDDEFNEGSGVGLSEVRDNSDALTAFNTAAASSPFATTAEKLERWTASHAAAALPPRSPTKARIAKTLEQRSFDEDRSPAKCLFAPTTGLIKTSSAEDRVDASGSGKPGAAVLGGVETEDESEDEGDDDKVGLVASHIEEIDLSVDDSDDSASSGSRSSTGSVVILLSPDASASEEEVESDDDDDDGPSSSDSDAAVASLLLPASRLAVVAGPPPPPIRAASRLPAPAATATTPRPRASYRAATPSGTASARGGAGGVARFAGPRPAPGSGPVTPSRRQGQAAATPASARVLRSAAQSRGGAATASGGAQGGSGGSSG